MLIKLIKKEKNVCVGERWWGVGGTEQRLGPHTAIGNVRVYKTTLAKRHLSKLYTQSETLPVPKYETKS